MTPTTSPTPIDPEDPIRTEISSKHGKTLQASASNWGTLLFEWRKANAPTSGESFPAMHEAAPAYLPSAMTKLERIALIDKGADDGKQWEQNATG
jgi:hypothetical protein